MAANLQFYLFIYYDLKQRAFNLNLFCPFIPFIRAEFPWRKIIFHITKHGSPFLWRITFLHNQVAAQLQNYIKWVNADRTFLHTGIAGSTSTKFFYQNIIM